MNELQEFCDVAARRAATSQTALNALAKRYKYQKCRTHEY
jgi:hypothetical protein